MKPVMMVAVVALLGACSVFKHIAGTEQCLAPTASEAKITKRVWR